MLCFTTSVKFTCNAILRIGSANVYKSCGLAWKASGSWLHFLILFRFEIADHCVSYLLTVAMIQRALGLCGPICLSVTSEAALASLGVPHFLPRVALGCSLNANLWIARCGKVGAWDMPHGGVCP
jgi:hypothetical protein